MFTVTTPPAVEPVTLAEAKEHLGQTLDVDDAMITGFLIGARQKIESHLSRSFINTGWTLTLDGFPGQYSRFALTAGGNGFGYPSAGALYGALPERFLAGTGSPIVIPRARLVSVESFSYLDANGERRELAEGEDYSVEPGDGGRICPAYGRVWPSARVYPGSVRIVHTMGYGATAADVPDTVKIGIKLFVSHLYENRDAVLTGSGVSAVPLPMGVKWILGAAEWGQRA